MQRINMQAKFNDINKRNINLDLIRIVATVFVIGVHFFLNTDYYYTKINGLMLFVFGTIRTLCMSCVPLFLILTGYLMNKKELSASYYKGAVKTLSIYIILSIITIVISFLFFDPYSGKNLADKVVGILEFNTISYAWYVEMYLGLFLLIPFINIIYKNLKNKKEKLFLICTVGFLCIVPAFCARHIVLIDWWCGIWPLMYYFIGAFLFEYPLKIKAKTNAVLLAAFMIFAGTLYYLISHNKTPSGLALFTRWYSILYVITSTLIFSLLLKINIDNISKGFSKLIETLSKLTFGIFLSSYIIDKIIYSKFNVIIASQHEKFYWYIPVIFTIFALSTVMSLVPNLIYNLISKSFYKSIKNT